MLGIGVDIISISRMAEILKRSGEIFLNRVYTDSEQQIGRMHHDPVVYYALTFAAKEAVFKLFGMGWEGVDLRDIEVSRGPLGEPVVELKEGFAGLIGKRGKARVLLSLSYDGDTAAAVAVLG